MTIIRIRPVALAAVIAAATIGLLAQPAAAQGKTWKHALLNAKADAGFFMMSAKHGFAEKQGLKLELLQVKDDQIGLKALIAGEVDSFEGGPQGAFAAARARRRRQDHRLSLGGGAARHLCARRHPQRGGPQGEIDCGVVAQYDAGSAGALGAGEIRRHPRPGEARRGRRRPRALSGAGRRRGRGRRGFQRISAEPCRRACIC